ncbi:7131_t:CDS:2 [Entrophospora sp. SA101]|nr:7131_t:CDS:2 [Entrophospora sp. SA101]
MEYFVGGGSISDLKNIISQYTEHSDHLGSIIDDLTSKREFIVFDLRRSKNDPLSIRVRWDKPLEVPDGLKTQISDSSSINIIDELSQSKFSIAGKEAITQAKKENCIVEFAGNFPLPPEQLGAGWHDFAQKIKERVKLLQNNEISIPQVDKSRPDKNSYFLHYKDLLDSRPLDEKRYIEGCKILTWLLSNGHIDQKIHHVGIKELNDSQ